MPQVLGVVVVVVGILATGGQRGGAPRSFNTVVNLEATAEASANVSMGDLDADGDLDLVLAKGRHTPLLDRVLLNDGKGGFVASDLGPTAGFQVADKARTPYAVAAGDLNNDRSPDIVLGYTSGPHSVFFNDGSGRQFAHLTFGDEKGAAYGFALGDINGDTFPDIALARSGAPNVLYLSGK